MEEEIMHELLDVLDKSALRHGEDKPLTIGHLRNMINLAMNRCDKRNEKFRRDMDRERMQIMFDQCGDRD